MKTKMKFFAAIGIMMGFVASANAADELKSATINSTANVQTPLVVTAEIPLNFGTVLNVTGVTKKINTAGVASSNTGTVTQTGVTRGLGKIVRSNGIVAYKLTTVPTFLTNSTSQLPIADFTTAYSLGTSGATKSSDNTDPGNVLTTVAAGTDDIYVHIGATVTPSGATNIIGTHSGSVTLTAEYN